jgi:uncharacterized protein YggE
MDQETSAQQKKKRTVRESKSVDYRWIIITALSACIVILVALWRPWEAGFDKNTRTIDVTGQATLKAKPDQMVFSPYYQFDNKDTQAAIKAADEKSKAVTAELKKLGVKDNEIKSQASGYDTGVVSSDGKTSIYTLSYTITLEDVALAQKIQDYLLTTSPMGQVTPVYGFAKKTQNDLETKARDEATKNARTKAEQSAKNLGFSIGGVKEVTDGVSAGSPYPLMGIDDKAVSPASSSLSLQSGENELTYSVKVVFYIR